MALLFGLIYLLAAVAELYLAVVIRRFRLVPATVPLLLVTLISALWALCNALFFLTPFEADKLFWFKFKMLAIVLDPLLLLVLAISHTTQRRWANWRVLGPMLVLACTTLFLYWTDNPLFRANLHLAEIGGIVLPQFQNGPWFWVHGVYCYLGGGLAILILLRSLRGAQPLFRRQTMALLVSILIPSIIDVANTLRIIQLIDPTPVVFTLTSFAACWALFRYRMLDITPIARNLVVENMNDLMLVVDEQERLVDFNPAAQEALGVGHKLQVGQPIDEVLQRWNGIAGTLQGPDQWRRELTTGAGENKHVYNVAVSAMRNDAGGLAGRMLMLHDITERKQTEDALRAANTQLLVQLEQIEQLQASLREQAIRDPLTNLYNRRYFEDTVQRELERATREDYTLTLVLIDIDHFKQVNDTHGHAAGDRVLQALAECLRAGTRGSDIVCRYGGEEFVVALPNVIGHAALERAEELRDRCEAALVAFDGATLRFTVSLGVATFPTHGGNIGQIMRVADDALYSAKNRGRNQVSAA